jgi:hypothetical protein
MPRKAPYGFSYDREIWSIPSAGLLAVATQANVVLSLPIRSSAELVGVDIVATTVGTGAGASRALNVRKGNATGTIAATVTATLANQTTLGTATPGTVTTAGGANKFDDTGGTPDTLTIELPAAGTAFTAGGLNLILTWRRTAQR